MIILTWMYVTIWKKGFIATSITLRLYLKTLLFLQNFLFVVITHI